MYNSTRAKEQHEQRGYAGNSVVIPNGFDTGAPPTVNADTKHVTVTLLARDHPIKGQEVFLEAAAKVRSQMPEVRFTLAGRGMTNSNAELSALLIRFGLSDRVALLGHVRAPRELLRATDVLCSASHSEGLSNVIGEAMAEGTPCVVTDVGESARLIGNTGRVVPAGSPALLADALLAVLKMTPLARLELGRAAQDRIRHHYSRESAAQRYLGLYDALDRPARGE